MFSASFSSGPCRSWWRSVGFHCYICLTVKANDDGRKSQLAIEYSYQVRESLPDMWVFWVHASSAARFEEGYRKIAERAKIAAWDNPEADILRLVNSWLSDETNGRW